MCSCRTAYFIFCVIVARAHRARADVTLRCLQTELPVFVKDHWEEPSSCEHPWFERHSAAVKSFLQYVHSHQTAPTRTKKLVFGFHKHLHHPWGSLSTHMNGFFSAAVALDLAFVLYDKARFTVVPARSAG